MLVAWLCLRGSAGGALRPGPVSSSLGKRKQGPVRTTEPGIQGPHSQVPPSLSAPIGNLYSYLSLLPGYCVNLSWASHHPVVCVLLIAPIEQIEGLRLKEVHS